MTTARPLRSARRQRGAALLTAMIIVTLVATLAAAMVWQQWRAVQVESAERARTQAAWMATAALDIARLYLREDQKSGLPTALTEPWAIPLEEARLSTLLAVDKSNADDGPEAFLSGNITDLQARYNLTNLVVASKIVPAELQTLERLCQTLGVDGSVAARIAGGLRDAAAATGAVPLQPTTVSQLAWLGIDASSIASLRPYVAILPVVTPVNLNTASKEVLAAAIEGLDTERLIQIRQRPPFRSPQDLVQRLSMPALPPTANVGVHSDFFEVRVRLRIADRVLTERSVVQRQANPPRIVVLQRERIAGLEQLGS
ncbi:MAG TPA: type II secretion system minor pseudopilin GspK [Burkholderiaceae bacterium]|nr:type II secretion system minor pseudopilin GspK [Burkholderiaceae bacterium]